MKRYWVIREDGEYDLGFFSDFTEAVNACKEAAKWLRHTQIVYDTEDDRVVYPNWCRGYQFRRFGYFGQQKEMGNKPYPELKVDYSW